MGGFFHDGTLKDRHRFERDIQELEQWEREQRQLIRDEEQQAAHARREQEESIKLEILRRRSTAYYTVSEERTPYMVQCVMDGNVYLTKDEYDRQVYRHNRGWECPLCGGNAAWSDDNYEGFYDVGQGGGV